MIIAIDGPAGSGKSTTARAVAERLRFHHLDSGALYRAVTWCALRSGRPPEGWDRLTSRDLDGCDISARFTPEGFRVRVQKRDVEAELRSPEVSAHVSRIAQVPQVRDWVNARLRQEARSTNVVADGRDLGTVVFPDAELKVFLVADAAARARRRLGDYGIHEPDEAQLSRERERLLERDRLDQERELAPLRQAADAVVLDTSNLSFDEQVEQVIALARQRGA